MANILNSLNEIKVETPVDKIISQIKDLIASGQIHPGEKLPPQRQLSERFGIRRTYVRDAIKKLEFYGIVKVMPQSGTVVAGLGITALKGLITDVLRVENNDFHSLLETRIILEISAAKNASIRRTKDDIVSISNALKEYEKKVSQGQSGVEEDLLFHLKIAEASKNSVLKSLMLVITPDIMTFFNDNEVCTGGRPKSALEEHHEILDYIVKKDPINVEIAMKDHLREILNFTKKRFPYA